MPINMKPSELGFEHSDRRATGCQKSYILRIEKNFHIFHPIFIKIDTTAHLCMPNNMEPSNMGFEYSDQLATGCSNSHISLYYIFKIMRFLYPLARRSECPNPNSDGSMLFLMHKWYSMSIFMKIGWELWKLFFISKYTIFGSL